MTTGRFSPVNRVTQTLLWPGLVQQSRQPNIASLLKEKAGYEVVGKGKWHLSYAANAAIGNGGEDWTADDIRAMQENFGWSGWNPPDAGNAIETRQPTEFGTFNGLATLGGANPDNDGRYIMGPTPGARGQTPGFGESVVDFLKNRAPGSASRFACSYRWSTRTTSMSTRPVGRRRATGMRTLPISVSSCRPTTATTS